MGKRRTSEGLLTNSLRRHKFRCLGAKDVVVVVKVGLVAMNAMFLRWFARVAAVVVIVRCLRR